MAWQIDAGHSSVEFTARHMMLTKVRGQFKQFSGTVEGDENEPHLASVTVAIDTASLSSGDEKRDAHLKSEDFFNVAVFPQMTFKSTRVEQIDANSAKLHGDLTVRDVTRPVVLDVEYHGMQQAPWGTTSAGFSATTKINREDFGLVWNVALETGGVLVGKEVAIEIEVELIKVEEPVAVAA